MRYKGYILPSIVAFNFKFDPVCQKCNLFDTYLLQINAKEKL